MSVTAEASLPSSGGLAPAFSAARARLGLVALLFAVAGVGWWWTGDQMRGMDDGPWTGLGSFGWFLGVWVVMMAAMMFPSVSPTVALYSRMTKQRSPLSPMLFASGYLLTWAAAGAVAFAIGAALNSVAGGLFAWDRAGRWTSGGTLVVAAVYELTPLKDVCLGKCRSPLGFLLGSWRDGPSGALRMGAKNGAWCVGCCWALMAALFALGIMSVVWMAVIAGLIAFEKTVPWRRVASYGTAAVLLALGLLVLTAPRSVPGLTTPSDSPMEQMAPMGS
jgi:predicted metal-binding membrane protein